MHKTSTDHHQTLVEHLVDLRKCIVRILWVLVGGFAICWTFSEQLMDIIRQPIQPFLSQTSGGGLVFLGVMDKFLAHLKISFLASVILTCPLWLFQVWKFVVPALYDSEKKFAYGFISFGTFLFLTGTLFAYFLVLPMAFKFLLNFGGSIDKPMITLAEYLSFFTTTTLVFGAAFELPLILTLLGILGVIDSSFLRKNRRYAVVVLSIISAIITPPDALSMFMLLIPLLGLYELSIWLVQVMAKSKSSV
ncbi:MAG: twin-arginine translocase subunit TatC [Bdellovibrionales bacterium]|nr:twin-arginine translocase subunit TatC [Bdellovibrionales bacterium]